MTPLKTFVYQLLFPNGRSYIGRAIDINAVFLSMGRRAKRGGNTLPEKAWREIGEPKLIVLSRHSRDGAKKAREEAIERLGTRYPAGYNETLNEARERQRREALQQRNLAALAPRTDDRRARFIERHG